jgi:hypothetical protein
MSHTHDARRSRRLASAVGLIGWPTALVIDAVVQEEHGNEMETLRAAVEEPGRFMAVAAVLLVSAILTVLGAYGVVHLVRDRGARLAHWGAGLLTLGALGHTAIATLQVVIVGGAPGGDLEEMAAMLTRLGESPALALIAPLITAYGLGMVVAAFAVWRAGLLRGWAPALAVLAFAVHMLPIGGGAAAVVVGVGIQVALLAVYGALGMLVARMRDEEWTPGPAPVRPDLAAV